MPSQLRVRWAKFRVTAVIAVALLILGVLMFLLTGGTLLEQKARLYLYIPDATGLSSGAPVRVDGVGIGVVDLVQFSGSADPARIIRVGMAIERRRLPSITSDSIAQISNDTVIGDKFVDISTGSAPGHVQPNGELRFRDKPDLMRSVDLSAFENELRLADATLTEIENGRTPLGEFVVGEQVYNSLRRRLTELQNTLRRATATTSQLGGVLYTDALYRKLQAPVLQIEETLARLQSGQGEAGRFLRNPAQFAEWRAMLSDLRRSVADARSAEFMQSDASYSDWTHAVSSLASQVDAINASPLLNSMGLYESWTGAAREMEKTVKEFRQNPQKFLRLKVF
jgi:phospholipid/cholesterol/gamma-HCH transport system substrate-binding protein